MLRKAFEEVVPYISNLKEIKEYVDKNENAAPAQIIEDLNRKIEESEGTLKTDYRILLNEFEKTINKRM